MRIPKEWYDEDQAEKQKEPDRVDEAIGKGQLEERPGDNRYIPDSGIKINADQLEAFKDISEAFIQPWEKWKNDVKSKGIANTNEFRIKEMSMIDILKIQHITQRNMLKYGYSILHKNIQTVFTLIAYQAYILHKFVLYIKRFLKSYEIFFTGLQ